jgi:beta-ureidopropionase / N-carbamoyl-L-amino-acid hydrolase
VHAGTTPIASRHDAGLVAASVVVEARRMCDSGDFGQLRATVGNLGISGGQTNVIPREASLTIDLRNPADDLMTAAEQHLAAYVGELAARHGVQISWERMAKTAVVSFHPAIQDLLAATADDLGLPYVRVMSGAGHDAQEVSAICPTAMVFVAGENGGISHTPREYSNSRACANGTDVLANAVLRLANQP